MSSTARTSAFLVALVAWIALAAQLLSTSLGAPETGMLDVVWRLLRFFTILTNLLVALTFSLAAAADRRPGPGWSGGLTLWILIVGVVNYALLYRPMQGLEFWADTGLHAMVPALVFLWWAAFADKRGLRLQLVVLWLSWPLIYVIYALGRGQGDGHYPYFFTDPGRVGWDGVIVWSFFLCVAFFVGGVMLVWMSRLLPNS